MQHEHIHRIRDSLKEIEQEEQRLVCGWKAGFSLLDLPAGL